MKPWILALGGGLLLLARQAAASSRSGAPILPGDEKLRFVSDMWASVSRVWPGSSDASRMLILTLAAYESGYGGSMPYRVGNNPFNITKGSADVPSMESGDQYCDDRGVCTPIKQKFRVYVTLDDSVRDLLSLLQGSRYVSAYTLLRVGDVGFAAALGNAGYYTLPINTYVSNFKGVLAGVTNRLRQLQLVA